MLIKAVWVLPVATPPIHNGALRVVGDAIREVGPAQAIPVLPGEETLSLYQTVLLPGFVNCHAHLEFSPLVSPPSQGCFTQGSFTSWVRSVMGERQESTSSETAMLIQRAAENLARTGTTTAALHVGGEIPAQHFASLPFRTFAFVEVIGLTEKLAEESLRKAMNWKVEALIASDRIEVFPTPHSLYALHKKILEEMLSRDLSLQSIHLLESSDENLFLRDGTGPMADLVAERGGEQPDFSPLRLLETLQKRLLIVHGNYLESAEIGLLRNLQASVIHCPGSHRYFRHAPLRWNQLKEAGLRVALGTDSLASNEELSMLAEMRLLREKEPSLSPEEILRMATIHGAEALGLPVGALETGKKADLIGVALDRSRDPLDAVLNAKEVSWRMIDGRHVPFA